jgi:hypothetical protein
MLSKPGELHNRMKKGNQERNRQDRLYDDVNISGMEQFSLV